MASTHTATTIQTSATNTAGSTTTSSTWNKGTAYSGGIMAKITNGATGPTVACGVTINISSDGSTWKYFSSATAGTTNSAVYPFVFEIPDWVMQIQAVFTGNTGQSVTVEAFAQELTTI